MSPAPKLLMWTYIPTHHQCAFLQALRDDGVDLVVHYFKRVSEARIRLGWADPAELPYGERLVQPNLASLDECPDWKERTHVIPGYGAAFLLLLALRLSRNKVTWVNWSEPSSHSPRWYLNYPLKRAYATLINRHALGALAIGDMAHRDFVRWGVDKRLIRFLPYSVAGLPSLPGNSAVTRSPPFLQFVFVGALCHRKGVDVLLRAFQLVLKKHPQARLLLIGYDESNGSYPRMANKLGLAQAAEFAGSVPAAEISDSLKSCEVLVLPSRFDGWGMVINEAASLGKALIATDTCGAAHHLIMPEINGFRVPPGDHRALAEAMLRYCREPELARTHGERSRKVFADFTPTRNAVRMRQCLSSLRAYKNPESKASMSTARMTNYDRSA